MKASKFPGHNVIVAKDQPEYQQLPAYHNKDNGTLTFCFELTKEEIDEVVSTGKIWFQQLTFNRPMNPIRLSTNQKDLMP